MTVVVVDNGSSHTDSLLNYLAMRGLRSVRRRYDELDGAASSEAFVLTGRIGATHGADIANAAMVRHAVSGGRILLGICYGAQVVAMTQGCGLETYGRKRYGMHQVRLEGASPLGAGTIDGFYSQWWHVSGISERIEVLGTGEGGTPDLFRVYGTRVYGCMFHPEASSSGHRLLDAVLEVSK